MKRLWVPRDHDDPASLNRLSRSWSS
ncbi:MAG: hypothetical protein JWM42_3543, partial [Burkholderia sp.]|nr:hypothetical protein [Burkholderia sp.]